MGLNQIIRRSSSTVDTSGALPPVLTMPMLGSGGVYVGPDNGTGDVGSVAQGRVSLGILGFAIVGALAFYYSTRAIQGGG